MFIKGTFSVDTDAEDEWSGIETKGKQMEEEYQDEEILATVTVVEDFDPDSIIHGPPPCASHESRPTVTTTKLARDNTPSKKPPKGKNKVKYETKAERRVEQRKQRARRTEKAELAGGKASRKNASKKGRH
jgi:ribosomal RNA-processing protein 17